MTKLVRYKPKRTMTKYRKKSYKKRRRPSVRTGFLPVQQKDITTFTIPTNVLNGYVQRYDFTISQLDNLPALTRLFDQYRIRKVTLQFNAQTFNDPTANPSMTCVSSIDLDGGVIPPNFETILQASNARVTQWGGTGSNNLKKFISLRPRYSNQIVKEIGPPVLYSQTIGNRNSWIDLADQGLTEHHGVVVGWRAPSGTLNFAQEVTLITTYHLEFRKFR